MTCEEEGDYYYIIPEKLMNKENKNIYSNIPTQKLLLTAKQV